MRSAVSAALGVYKPRRPQASPLLRLVSDHLQRRPTVSDDRFAREDGPWRRVVAQVVDTFLTCGALDHGAARIRFDDCAHAYLLAFSCTCRCCCPRCHAKRLTIWTQGLDTTPLAPTEATRRWAKALRRRSSNKSSRSIRWPVRSATVRCASSPASRSRP